MEYKDLKDCKHLTLHTYIGYVNVYYCGMCGLRFDSMPKYVDRYEGEKCTYKEHRGHEIR